MLWVLIRSASRDKMFLMSTHNIFFHGEINKKLYGYRYD